MATTYCDYQFLPHPINYDGAEHKSDVDVWRYFYSPRYPAKYPNHIKCSYKFVGRYVMDACFGENNVCLLCPYKKRLAILNCMICQIIPAGQVSL